MMIITNASYDDFYYKQLISFLTSLSTHNKDVEATIGLVDYPKKESKKLQQVFKNYNFIDKEIVKVDKRGIHFILLRIEMILECFKQKRNAAWLDTDVVVRGDLSEFLEVEPNQFKVLCRDVTNAKMSSRFNAGIMNLGYSKATELFVLNWYERLKNNMVWGMGQITLNDAFNKSTGVILEPLDLTFNDIGDSSNPRMFDDTSIIWHSKLKHFENPKFKKEYSKYLINGMEMLNNVS